jgi:hypothetical protein
LAWVSIQHHKIDHRMKHPALVLLMSSFTHFSAEDF